MLMPQSLEALVKHQPFAVELLNQSIQNHKIAHAYIFKGPNPFTLSLVHRFVQALICPRQGCLDCSVCQAVDKEIHPDLHIFRASEDSKTGIIKLAQIKDLIQKTALPPLQSPYQFFVIEGADKMNKESSNALLKTLEEPSSKTIIILLTPSTNRLLPTILSRAQLIPLYLDQAPATDSDRILNLENLNNGRLSLQQQFDLSDQLARFSFDELIEQFQFLQQTYWTKYKQRFYQQGQLPSERDYQRLERLDEAIEQLQYRGNIKLILELFFLDFERLSSPIGV